MGTEPELVSLSANANRLPIDIAINVNVPMAGFGFSPFQIRQSQFIAIASNKNRFGPIGMVATDSVTAISDHQE